MGGDEETPVSESPKDQKAEESQPIPDLPKPKETTKATSRRTGRRCLTPMGLLPTGEEKTECQYMQMWMDLPWRYNGSTWRITDRTGGEILSLLEKRASMTRVQGRQSKTHPSDQFAKDALFRLAVAYQGSEDIVNAERLFKQFIREFPEDKNVAASYLSLADLVMSRLDPEELPTLNKFLKLGKIML